jgi:hypothetical protein
MKIDYVYAFRANCATPSFECSMLSMLRPLRTNEHRTKRTTTGRPVDRFEFSFFYDCMHVLIIATAN